MLRAVEGSMYTKSAGESPKAANYSVRHNGHSYNCTHESSLSVSGAISLTEATDFFMVEGESIVFA